MRTVRSRLIAGAALGTAMLIGSGLSAPPAQAAYIVTLEEVGTSVVATGSGTLDLTSLTSIGSSADHARIVPSGGFIITGPTSFGGLDVYIGFTGPTSFGSGIGALANSGSGNLVGISGSANEIAVPSGYTSGTLLSDSSTYDNQTFSSLGVTPDTYVWTWGSGAHADSFTLDIVAAAVVPEPSTVLQLGVGLAGLALAGFLRSRRT